MNSGAINRIPKLDYFVLLLILALAYYIAFIPHQSYPYPVHVDEWVLLANMKAIQGAGHIVFTDPFSGQPAHIYGIMETGFYLFWGIFQDISGISWLTIFRYFPGVVFMMTVLSVYVLARREGFGWEAAFFASLIITTVGILGPAFLVPVAMGLLFVSLSIFLAFNFRHFWSYLTLFIFVCFLLSMHAPTAICLVLILLPHIIINLKGAFRHSLGLVLALGIPFLAVLMMVFGLFLQTAGELLATQSLPGHVNFPLIIVDYGYLPIALGLIGTFVLAIRGRKKDYALVLGLLAILLMLAIFYTLHYGIMLVYWRGLIFALLILSIVAGAGLRWIKKIRMPESFVIHLKMPLVTRNIGVVFCLALIGLTLFIGIPARQDTPYYHMIDDYDYEKFSWIRANISDNYERAILDPLKATAFTAVTQKMVFTRIHSYPTASSRKAEDFLRSGCSDTAFLRENGISIVYSRSPCNNPDLTKVAESVYILNSAN